MRILPRVRRKLADGARLSLLWAILSWGSPGLAELTPVQLIEKAKERDKENLRAHGGTPCRLTEIREKLDEQGAVEEREEKILQTAGSGAPVPGARETERISPEMGAQPAHQDDSIFDHIPAFHWVLEGEDETGGEPCFRLRFTPQREAPTSGGRAAVIARASGRCWIAKKDFSKVRLEGRLTKPLELAGFLVTVQEVEFLTTTQRLGSGIAAPRQIQYRFRVEVFPFFEFHERHTQEFKFLVITQN